MNGNSSSILRPSQVALSSPLYYPSAVQGEALARLRYMCTHHHRLGLLLGATGSGKSTVLQVLAQDLVRKGHVVVMCALLGRENYEFLSTLATGLGHFPENRDSLASLWRCIVDRLRENRYQQRSTVILLDDADEAEMDVVTSITRLVQADPTSPAPYTVIVSAHLGRCQLLGPRLKDLCELRVELEPWDQDEVRHYVGHLAGGIRPFQADAIELLVQLTGGIPRRIVHLVELARLASIDLECVDADTVESAYHELSTQGMERES